MPNRVIFGDSRKVLEGVESESVSLVVTSPPYFVGREYETYLQDEGEYWQLMSDVFSQMRRIVEPYGKAVINFPDRYANAKVLGYPKEILYAHEFDSIMSGCGFDLWARVVWDKRKIFIDGANHLAAPSNKTGQMRVAPNWEYVFVWRKHSQPLTAPKKKVDMTDDERIEWTDSIWSFDSVSVNEVEAGFKLAKFPEELPRRLILMYTQPGDTVLDPFSGTCTVAKVANDLNREFIMVELNEAMKSYVEKYLEGIEYTLERTEV